jgi:hypothetical protein
MVIAGSFILYFYNDPPYNLLFPISIAIGFLMAVIVGSIMLYGYYKDEI